MQQEKSQSNIEPLTIFSPFRIGPLRLKNRLVALPVYTGYAYPDGSVSSMLIEHYTRLAQSGVAMVVVANAAVSLDGIVSKYNLMADRDELIPGLVRLASAIKRRGALACLQLNHAGRFARTNQPLLPSPVDRKNLLFNIASLKDFMEFFPFEKRFAFTRYFLRQFNTWRRVMTGEDRERVITGFGEAAFRAYEAGFDMIELHGANGYLLCQFLSPFTNKVKSSFGGDFRERVSFPLAVIKEIKQRLPEGFPVGFRLLLREWVPGGIDLPEALAWAVMLEREGISYLSASAGTYNSIFSSPAMKKMTQPGFLLKDMVALSRGVKVPTIISGRVIKPSIANKCIKEGAADLVGLGRPIRADFGWVTKAASGEDKEITHCINCNWCLKRVVLNEGFNCRRWEQIVQERTDLDHKLLTRMYKGLMVAADLEDLNFFKTSLSIFLPNRQYVSTTISPTILFLRSDRYSGLSRPVRDEFINWGNDMLSRLGFQGGQFNPMVREAKDSFEKEVHAEAERGNYGVILMGHNRNEVWRGRLLYKTREKVVGLIGSNDRQAEILVPVDLSMSSLLVLMFICHSFVGKPDINLNFIHVLDGPVGQAEHRWEKLKEIVGWDEDFQLELVTSKGDVATVLLDILKSRDYGTIVMGKRGLSGMKRWLLGSVSAGVFHGLTDHSLFLID